MEKVKVFFIVQRHLFFNQANGQVGAVDQRGFVRLAVARQQGALRRNGAALAVAHHVGYMGKAGAVVQFKHRIKRHTVHSAVHHGQVTGGDALILQQLFKNHTRNTARKINKVIVVLHLLQKGRIRQKAAVFAVIAGKCLFNADGKIFIKVSIQLHRPVRKHRFRCAGIQNM